MLSLSASRVRFTRWGIVTGGGVQGPIDVAWCISTSVAVPLTTDILQEHQVWRKDWHIVLGSIISGDSSVYSAWPNLISLILLGFVRVKLNSTGPRGLCILDVGRLTVRNSIDSNVTLGHHGRMQVIWVFAAYSGLLKAPVIQKNNKAPFQTCCCSH